MQIPRINHYYKPTNPEYDAVCIMRSYWHYNICSVVERSGCLYIKPIMTDVSLSIARQMMVNKYAAVVVENGEGRLVEYIQFRQIKRMEMK